MVSSIARIAKFLNGAESSVEPEILPPERGSVPARDSQSVEARAGTFAALFLDNAPRDLRGGRPGSR
jgi:hypothetical protein